MSHVRAIVMFLGYFPMISLIDPKTRPFRTAKGFLSDSLKNHFFGCNNSQLCICVC